MKQIVNKPIAGTFGWLKTGGTEIELNAEPASLVYTLGEGEHRTLVVEDTGESTVIAAELAAGASLDLIQIRRNAVNEMAHTDIRVSCGEDAAFHWYRLLLDGEATYDNCSVTLIGDGSSFAADVGYRLKGTDVYDVNCEAIHLGKGTESTIFTSGVLADQANKLMRGTIDFRTGCAGAVGSESEDVLLMDETVSNQTVPVILCAEEDVVGNHGATIGRPDETVLYYMESRGIDAEAACEMLAQAKVDAVIDRIPDEALREELKN